MCLTYNDQTSSHVNGLKAGWDLDTAAMFMVAKELNSPTCQLPMTSSKLPQNAVTVDTHDLFLQGLQPKINMHLLTKNFEWTTSYSC